MKRFLILILALIMAAAFGSGCKDEKTESVSPVVLRDFETYNPDFMSLQMSTNFGKIEVNTDEQYVKSGEQSAKLTIYGGYYYNDPPEVGIPFYSTAAGYNYRELSAYSSVTVSAYNAEDFDIPMYWNFTFFDGQSSPVETVNLKPGWNEVEMSVEADTLNMFYDLGDCSGLKLGFDDYSVQGYSLEDAPAVYLDDLTLIPRPDAYSAPAVDIVVDPYEICSFEKAYQAHILKPASETGNIPGTQVLSADGTVQPTEGEKMLKVTFPKGSDGYARLSFSSKLFPIIDFTQFKDDPEKYKIAYDIYNAAGQTTSIATYYIWGGVKEWPNSSLTWGVNMEATNTNLPQNAWLTYEMPLSTIYGWNKSTLENEFHMFLMFNDGLPAGSAFYLDNFRIVKCG